MIEIGTTKLAGSRPITRFLAMRHNLYPTSPREIYELESVCDFIESIYEDVGGKIALANDPEGVEAYFSDTMIDKLKMIEARVKNSASGFFIGKETTFADLYSLTFVMDYFLGDHVKEAKESYLDFHAPKLKQHAQMMLAAHPHLKEYFAGRPKSHA
jgi:glutathione S-transferase